MARKLAVLLHRLWLTEEAYEPLRNTNRRAAVKTQQLEEAVDENAAPRLDGLQHAPSS